MSRTVNTGQFFCKNQEMADENVRRIEYEDGMKIVTMSHEVEYPVCHSEGWKAYEYQTVVATKKERLEIIENRRKEDEAKGIFHPFTSN
ncbi:MAG: hypothetical protein PHF34_08810 [Bacteroidales bacterium]|nr:hypothetical protein [Bacteroidales bacterium]